MGMYTRPRTLCLYEVRVPTYTQMMEGVNSCVLTHHAAWGLERCPITSVRGYLTCKMVFQITSYRYPENI